MVQDAVHVYSLVLSQLPSVFSDFDTGDTGNTLYFGISLLVILRNNGTREYFVFRDYPHQRIKHKIVRTENTVLVYLVF